MKTTTPYIIVSFILILILCGMLGYYAHTTSMKVKLLEEHAKEIEEKMDSLIRVTNEKVDLDDQEQAQSFWDALFDKMESKAKEKE
jgi:ABC-type uncharacterized transport system involved in gliding motility auxiliary subunit